MCLGVPGQVLSIRGRMATVDFWGVQKNVRLDNVTEPVVAGDYIIDHAGYAVRKLAMEDVNETLAMYEVILTEAGCDPIAMDVVDELERADSIEVEVEEPVMS